MTPNVTHPQAAALDRLNECVPRIAAAAKELDAAVAALREAAIPGLIISEAGAKVLERFGIPSRPTLRLGRHANDEPTYVILPDAPAVVVN